MYDSGSDDVRVSTDLRLSEVCTLRSAAGEIGVPVRNVRRWCDRSGTNGFPAEVARVGGLAIFNRKEVLDWYQSYVSTRGGGDHPDLGGLEGNDGR